MMFSWSNQTQRRIRYLSSQIFQTGFNEGYLEHKKSVLDLLFVARKHATAIESGLRLDVIQELVDAIENLDNNEQ